MVWLSSFVSLLYFFVIKYFLFVSSLSIQKGCAAEHASISEKKEYFKWELLYHWSRNYIIYLVSSVMISENSTDVSHSPVTPKCKCTVYGH